MRKVFRFFYLSSLNVAAAVVICSVAFYRLPDGRPLTYFVPLLQLFLCTWLIYILDRLFDNKKSVQETERHQFHFKNQYNLQAICVALVFINLFLLFFEPEKIVIGGALLALIVTLYLLYIVPIMPGLKELTMPGIFGIGVIFAPFILSPAILMSSWLLALMFFLTLYQNLFSFTFFEQSDSPEKSLKWKKIINWMGALNLFLFITFFLKGIEYNNAFALIITIISAGNSLIVAYSEKFKNNYRWIMDGLLFLPLLLIFLY